MARIEDLPQPTHSAILALQVAAAATQPFDPPRPLSSQRVAMVSSAALIRRGDAPFQAGSGEFRVLPSDLPAGAMLMSHVSVNYDRTGWQHDRRGSPRLGCAVAQPAPTANEALALPQSLWLEAARGTLSACHRLGIAAGLQSAVDRAAWQPARQCAPRGDIKSCRFSVLALAPSVTG